MNDKLQIFQEFIDNIKKEERYRNFFQITRLKNSWPIIKQNNRDVTVWCGTDYLSMSIHSIVTEAAQKAIENHGVGSGGTRNIAGTYDYIVELEDSLANLHQKEKGLVFSSGYLSNLASIEAIGKITNKKMVIFSDELNHASIIEGIRSSGCQKLIFKHNDINHLEKLVSQFPLETPKLIIFESVYSMNGNIADIKEIVRIAEKYQCLTYVDEVHAVAVYGNRGAGICDILGLSNKIDIIQGSLSKGFGVIGGYITGNSTIIDAIRSGSSGFIFTSTMPIPISAACLASVNYLKKSQIERDKHWSNAGKILKLFDLHGIKVLSNNSNIMSVPIFSAKKSAEVSQYMNENFNLYVQHINYPTVKKGEERLRITTNPNHTDEMIEYFVDSLSKTLKILNVKNWMEFKQENNNILSINQINFENLSKTFIEESAL
jgi:5-aminolevulinate synthase